MQKKLLSLAVAALLPTLHYAQNTTETTETADNSTLDTILVESVYAVPAERDNTGSSVTVLDEADFQERDATYVTDVLKTVPGIAIGATGGHGAQTSVFMRGADSNHVLVVVDGIKANPASGSSFNFGTLPLSNVERIEVLRGEQSALWGSDAIGGVINIITKSGKYADKPFNADINLGAGSNDTYNFDTSLYGRKDGLYYALNAASNRTHGISSISKHRFTYTAQNGNTINTGGAVEDDKFQRGSVSLRIGHEYENAGVEAYFQHVNQTTHFDPSSLATEATTDPRTDSEKNAFKLSGYLGSTDDLLRHSAYVSNSSSRDKTSSSYPSQNKGNRRQAGYQLDVNFDREGATTQGITGLIEYNLNSFDTNNFADEKTLKQNSVAFEYRLFNNNDHAFSAGVRYDNNNEFDNAVTYRLAGGYRINDNFRLHSSIGTGIQNPSMYDYFGYDGRYIANLDLKPEKSRGGDIGLLMESSDQRHQLDVTYFNRRVNDKISVLSSTFGTFSRAINIEGTSKFSGVELAYNGQLTDQLTTYANYTYTKSEDPQGKQFQRRPEHQASAGIAYQVNDQWAANVNMVYVGERLNKHFDSTTYAASDVDMPDYTVFNLGSSYQVNKNIETYLQINNAFDKNYENVIGYGQPERHFYLGIKGSW